MGGSLSRRNRRKKQREDGKKKPKMGRELSRCSRGDRLERRNDTKKEELLSFGSAKRGTLTINPIQRPLYRVSAIQFHNFFTRREKFQPTLKKVVGKKEGSA